MRGGLGASRGRIVLQLMVESMIVALPAAALGIGVALVALEHVDRIVALHSGGGMPFWVRNGQDASTVAYAVALAVFAAALAAVIPGLQATGARAHVHLKSAGSHGLPWSALDGSRCRPGGHHGRRAAAGRLRGLERAWVWIGQTDVPRR